MFIPHEGPGTWQSFLKRKDNVGLTIMEARQKYLKEQLLFEGYISQLNTLSTVSTAAAGAAGGPAPSTGGGGGGGGYDIEFKVNTAYNITTGYYDVPNPTTRLNLNFSTTGVGFFSFTNGNVWNGDVTIDWGDGTVETKTAYDVGGTNTSNVQSNWYGKIGLVQHDYATDGEYTVKIKGPGAYYLRFMWTPLVELIKYDPSLTEDFRCLFAYMPRAATQNFVTDISNWTIPAGKSLAFVASCQNSYNNINSLTERRKYGCEIDFSNWDISSITSLEAAFAASNGFQDSQIANWVIPSTCTSLKSIFSGLGSDSQFSDSAPAASITNLDVSNWDTSGVQDWNQAFFNTGWGGTGANSLDFTGATSGFSLTHIFKLFPSLGGILPPVPDWNYGGDATSHGILFPGFSNPGPGSQNWAAYAYAFSKADFGTTLIGWANNPDLTINSKAEVTTTETYTGLLTDFDYSADANVSAALTTLQNTKGWTLVGFTF